MTSDYPKTAHAWRTEAAALFRGLGSFGNGSALRVAPLGAYFADDPDRIAEPASLSSIPTHSHSEAVAGRVAVLVAAGLAWQMKTSAEIPSTQPFLQHIYVRLPDNCVRKGIRNAIELPPEASVEAAVAKLGNGSAVTAPIRSLALGAPLVTSVVMRRHSGLPGRTRRS